MNMKTKNKAILLGAAAVIGSYLLFANGKTPSNSVLDEPKAPVVKTAYTAGPAVQPVDFEKAAAAAVPSVVHIKTTMKFKEVSGRQGQDIDPFGGFDDDFFRRFFGEGQGRVMPQPDQKASGSGVIISSDGYIVTNNHVVNGATAITVTLNNRRNYTAKVIGTDPNTDLALIKIDGKDLPVMSIGNSDDVKLGQWVLAIGYPLNLDVTVTQGIVSAKSRNIGINTQASAPVESFIQTDAAVNPGSSGGALVNTNGELIAINSAIASPTGAFAGYAYAIPSNLMKKVIGDIMKYGSVQRGYLGISMTPEGLDDAKKKELGITSDAEGVFVLDVDPKGAAGEAGLKKGDVITKVNGEDVNTDSRLAELIARQKPGDKVKITYVRGGEQHEAEATLKNKPGTFASMNNAAVESLGGDFSDLSKEDAAKLGISGGVVVNNIHNGVLSNQTNMRPGFVITKIGDIAVHSVAELKDALSKQGSNFQIEGVYPGSDEVYYYGINDFKK
ncbi:trypsin-like peptidase domain-containing protein [Puia dinghuensis]|uniref:Serine protease n=1 Tax=Puia dinghuensis TaxID=1792502 RepID=A0A8J2UJ45_9BACT|nr:trypsin-like peptidase domain-containing protein [Puia dinghuensis]GGB24380.1 serine protease [Puia dinghuensis]